MEMNLIIWIVGAALLIAVAVPLFRNHQRAKWVALAARYLFRLNVILPEQSKEAQDAFMASAFAEYSKNQSDRAAKALAIRFFREFAVEHPRVMLSDALHEKPWVAAVETLGRWGVEDFGVSLQVKMTLDAIKELQAQLRNAEKSAA